MVKMEKRMTKTIFEEREKNFDIKGKPKRKEGMNTIYNVKIYRF